MNKMLKKDLINKISDELVLQKQDVSIALDIILDTMGEALAADRRVELRGFGSFSTRKRKARNTKNPRTGVLMNIPERKTLHFTMSKSLKESLISKTE
jgi:integration host factor subunit beta